MGIGYNPDAESGDFYSPPREGVHNGVIAQYVDEGFHDNPFGEGKIHKAFWIVQVDEKVEEGKFEGQRKEVKIRFPVPSSLKPPETPDQYRPKLQKFLEMYQGKRDRDAGTVVPRKLTDKQLRDMTAGDGWEPTAMEGQPCMILVEHRQSKAGHTYADVTALLPPPEDKSRHLSVSDDFTRWEDRDRGNGKSGGSQPSGGIPGAAVEPEDEDQSAVPF